MTTQLTDDQVDKLIRPTSSILHLVEPQVSLSSIFAPCSAHSSTSQLDRIALLFITKRKANAIAVTADLSEKSVIVRLAADDASVQPESEVLDVAPNRPDSRDNFEALKQDVTSAPGPDWIAVYLQVGSVGVSSRNHAAQLEYLIQKLQLPTPKGAQAMKNLKRYIYFQCLPKLEERFFATVPGLEGRTFKNVFDELTPEIVMEKWKVPTTLRKTQLENATRHG
ncbi:hypothetical protein FRB95_011972 [Tulasnella sp. JGI-2019a]|nr:hypothetical protein FRB95_011972 [Tulasnella sp. JGI-2019a]